MQSQSNSINPSPEHQELFIALQGLVHDATSPKWREPFANESSFCGKQKVEEYAVNYEFGKSEIHGGWVLHLLITAPNGREVMHATGRGQGDPLGKPESISVYRADRLEMPSFQRALNAR